MQAQRLAHLRASARLVPLKLYPPLPDSRISATVKDRKDDQSTLANPEIHGIWEATRDRASNIAQYNWIALGCGRSSGDGLFDLDNKFFARAGALLVVTDGCILKLAFRSAPEDDPKRHRPKRDRTEALTSSQGTTSGSKERPSFVCRAAQRPCRGSGHGTCRKRSESRPQALIAPPRTCAPAGAGHRRQAVAARSRHAWEDCFTCRLCRALAPMTSMPQPAWLSE